MGRLWVLGANDPEMERIEKLLHDAEEEVAYAVGEDGRRVHPGNAYQAAGVRPEIDEDPRAYLVECAVAGHDDVVVIDHHRPGDPGYGRGPDEFLAASSIGQVVGELAQLGRLPAWERESDEVTPQGVGTITRIPRYSGGPPSRWAVEIGRGGGWRHASPSSDGMRPGGVYSRGRRRVKWAVIPQDLVLAAAADHCPAAAYQGKCEGVFADDLLCWRAEQHAAFQGRTPEDVIADVERATETLSEAERVAVYTGDHDGSSDDPRDHPPLVADLRGECDSCHGEEQDKCRACSGSGLRVVPELPEAGLRMGIAYLANVPDRSGRTKVVLGGAGEGTPAGPAPISAFLGGWAEDEGLVDLYGDPARGFAGGYET